MTHQNHFQPLRVLSLDGGGMRGLYTATLLKELSEILHQPILDIGNNYDLIVGTSTGAILAAGLTAGVSIEKIIDLYVREGPKIFTDPMPEYSKKLAFISWLIRNLTKAANSDEHLNAILDGLFGTETLGELYSRRRIALCVTSVNLLKENARVFKTGHVPTKVMDDGLRITDVCLASAAAPIYLPLAQIENAGVFADGGLWANNPIMVALVEALELAEGRDIEIISIGTCSPASGSVILKSELNRGLLGWLFETKTLTVSMNAQAHGHNNVAKLLIPHLTNDGRSISFVRLPQTTPSADYSKYLKLDLASEKAVSALQQLGKADAVAAFQLVQEQSHEGGLIKKAFTKIPQSQEAKINV